MTLCECGCGESAPLAQRSQRGRKRGEPQRFVRGHAMRGKNHSATTRRRMSTAHAGFRHTEESRRKLSEARPHGQDHPDWKGDAVAYPTLHNWIKRHKTKTSICSRCGAERKTDWANVSGEYRRDLDDFVEMCRSCHKKYDIGRRNAA